VLITGEADLRLALWWGYSLYLVIERDELGILAEFVRLLAKDNAG
jgi:hypothetical protein